MVIEKVAWLRLENGRLLVARSHGQDALYLPGGKPEPGEDARAALVREIREELGVELRPESITFRFVVMAPAHGKSPGTMVRIACHTAEHQGVPAPHGEIAEIAWLTYAERAQASEAVHRVLNRLTVTGELLPH
jgi:8-oxo-dGTP diphosphatase